MGKLELATKDYTKFHEVLYALISNSPTESKTLLDLDNRKTIRKQSLILNINQANYKARIYFYSTIEKI